MPDTDIDLTAGSPTAKTTSGRPEIEIEVEGARAGGPPPGPPPIFIVGCQRSGTTLLRLMLDSHPNISCGPESGFLENLVRITDSDWQRLSQFGYPKQYWYNAMARFFDGIQRDYATSRGKGRWADKTPKYALYVDFLDRLFPRSYVIHVIRDPRDVVASHRHRWGWRSALKAAAKWPRYVSAARESGGRLSSGRYLEVRYEDMVADPEGVMRRVLALVGEPWDDAVLHHDRAGHDVPDKYKEFSARRRAEAGDGSAVYRNRVGAGAKELDPLLRLVVWARDGRLRRKLGYGRRCP